MKSTRDNGASSTQIGDLHRKATNSETFDYFHQKRLTQRDVGFPVFIPDDPEKPFLVNSEKEKQRRKLVAKYIKNIIEQDKPTAEISGDTLFNDMLHAKTPKRAYIYN